MGNDLPAPSWGPGDGAVAGVVENAVDSAVWNVTVPSTFCIDLVNVEVPGRTRARSASRYPSACSLHRTQPHLDTRPKEGMCETR